MARWKLMINHYLNVPGTEWEYKEVARTGPKTGRQVKRTFAVPRLLDISDPQDWTNRWGHKDNEDGEVIVCHEGKGEPSDVIFIGEPSPDMQPLDDEAKVISASLMKKWEAKPDMIPGEYSQSLVDRFQVQMDEAKTKTAEVKGMDQLIEAMTRLMEQNATIMAAMVANAQPARRV